MDWTSLAQNLIPAVVGGVAGSQRGGMGAARGAIYGLGSGARYGIETDLERQKANAEIARQNQQLQQGQQRIDQETRQIDLQARNYGRLDRLADEQIKNYELERQKDQQAIDIATKTQEGQAQFRLQLPPDKQAMFDASPNKQGFIEQHYKDREWETKTNSSAQMLGKLGLDAPTARMLGPTGTAHLIGSILESRNKPRERFGFHYDAASGMGFSYDKQSGSVTTQKLGEPKVSPEKRTTIEKSLRDEWKARNGVLGKMAEDSGDWSAYDEWRASPMGKVQAGYLAGDITFQQAQDFRNSIGRQEKEWEGAAVSGMRATAPNMSEEDFKAYLNSPKGQNNLRAWKEHVRTQERRPTQTSIGPVQFDPSISPEERAAIKAKLGAPAPKEKAPTAPAPKKSGNAKESLLKDFGL